MPNYRPSSNNRLLALEQELLGKKRSTEARQSRRDIADNQRQTNNSLLSLEQALLGQQRKPKKRKPESKRSRVQSQVFDTGEAIELQYNTEVFPVAAAKIAAASLPHEAGNANKLPIQDFPINNEKSDILAVDDSSKPPLSTGKSANPYLEASEPDLAIIPTQVVFKSRVSGDMNEKPENSLSQPAEIIYEIDPKSNHLQEDDIHAARVELTANQEKTANTSLSPQQESENEQNNPNAIFDHMGKNVAYATTFNVGTIVLEQLFDEFDNALDQEEQVNNGKAKTMTE